MVLTKIGHHRADLAHFGEGNLPKLPLVMVKLVNLCHSYMFILILMLQALHLTDTRRSGSSRTLRSLSSFITKKRDHKIETNFCEESEV